MSVTCPCCGLFGLSAQHDICDFCGWTHDQSLEVVREKSHPESWLLWQAQRYAAAHRLCDPRMRGWRGEPWDQGTRDPEWKPLDDYASEDLELLFGALEKDVSAVERALENGADIESSFRHGTYHGLTPLMWAIGPCGLPVVQTLLAHGANPNARGKHEDTVLTLAVFQTDFALIKVLLKAGADVGLPDASGRTPLSVLEAVARIEGEFRLGECVLGELRRLLS